MALKLSELKGYDIAATDGSLGKVSNLFFDDHTWSVRYLVVDTGWLFGRKVLISPQSIAGVNIGGASVAVEMTRQQVEDAPGVETDRPVSRQEEVALHGHYGWQPYWEVYPAGVMGAPAVPLSEDVLPGHDAPPSRVREEAEGRGDPNLRSADEVEGYDIQATDGEIGHVEDFMVDEIAWVIRYFVVDTRNWLPGGRKVLISPASASDITWADRSASVTLTREQVKNSPAYDPDRSGLLTRDVEAALHDHYALKYYWM
ncbi:PRC-barrel domain-containing protein [Thalassobaculum salexigens]|uniref:PRC-barrel domain-containing protein n=1 Tax=Thalassobaculum salexigens TaxID=455360 RepID=UPI00248EC1A9|nr:PRC-barrel domain-containing protein [Thalassobaculum salexigens]